jgi:hypothetical protein
LHWPWDIGEVLRTDKILCVFSPTVMTNWWLIGAKEDLRMTSRS